MRDPHEILGISRAANEAEIKRAFRAKAKLYHPDLHPNDPVNEREFRDIVAAYHECLKRRQEKDALIQKTHSSFSDELNRAGAKSPPPPRPKPKPQQSHSFPEDTVDVGATKRPPPKSPPQRPPKPEPKKGFGSFLKETILGSFEQMVQKNIDAKAKPQKTTQQKSSTLGSGEDHQYSVEVGFLEARNGSKKNLKLRDGRGVSVKIPPDTREGQTLRLQGMGSPSRQGRLAGDALVQITIIDDLYAERSNNDFFLRLPVTLSEAALGTEIRIPGLYQDLMLKIPEGSNSGTNLRLKGKGFKDKDTGQVGDQYVTLEVKLPGHTDRRLQAFLREWSQDFDYDVRKNIGMGSTEQSKT